MNEQDPRIAAIFALEEQARQAFETAASMKKRVQDECPHPLNKLSFMYSGVSSYSGAKAEHSMRIVCTACDGNFRNSLVIHDDPY
jgi:hypothetical protein